MATKHLYIGSMGPFIYDDEEDYPNDPGVSVGPIRIVDPDNPGSLRKHTLYSDEDDVFTPDVTGFGGGWQAFTSGDATPSIANGNKFMTTGTTAITDFDDLEDGKIIYVYFNGLVGLVHGSGLHLQKGSNYTPALGEIIAFVPVSTPTWIEIGNISDSGGSAADETWQAFASGDATPSVAGYTRFKTAGSTAITDFDDGTEGQAIHVWFDGNVAITHNAAIIYLSGKETFTPRANCVMTFILDDSNIWHEVGGASFFYGVDWNTFGSGDSTPSVWSSKFYEVSGSTTITDFDNGVEGQLIFVKGNSSVKIANSASINLANNADMTPPIDRVLSFVCDSSGNWWEVGMGSLDIMTSATYIAFNRHIYVKGNPAVYLSIQSEGYQNTVDDIIAVYEVRGGYGTLEAKMEVTRGATGGAGDRPTDWEFWVCADGSSSPHLFLDARHDDVLSLVPAGSEIHIGGNKVVDGRMAAVSKLTNNTGGSVDLVLDAVSGTGDDSTINNNFAELNTKIDSIINRLGITSGHGLTSD